MATVNINLTCDLLNAPKVLQHCKPISSENTNKINVAVFEGGTPKNIDGSVTAYIMRPDGATITKTGTISGNAVSVSLPASAYSVPGVISISIKNISDETKTTLAAIVACVQ